MATWNVTGVTSDTYFDISPDTSGEEPTTTRGQLGALAAGAVIARCGAGSALLRVMGRDQAAALVRALWHEWVAPTLTRFVLEVECAPRGPACLRRRSLTLSLVASPLLASVARGPAAAPARGNSGAWVDARRFAERAFLPGGTVLVVRDLPTGAKCPVWSSPRCSMDEFAATARWAACVSFDRRPAVRSCTLAVASLAGIPGQHDRYDGVDGDAIGRTVAVGLPMVSLVSSSLFRVYSDPSDESAFVVVHFTESGAVIFVVDVEQTYKSKSLVLLSTTAWTLPHGHSFVSLVVMRNWDHESPAYRSRTFIVKTVCSHSTYEVFRVDECSGRCRYLLVQEGDNVEDVFRLSDSLFCVGLFTKHRTLSYKIYHRDNMVCPLNLPETKAPNKENKVLTNRIEVIVPMSGFVVLTVNIPEFAAISLTTPFSCWF
ncbi:hypothetical protein Pelo_18161 [Pelomyxa schiedti]|nr:hypothetical protein Pelo_18161 [Pelomyxa schiedti]